MANRTQVIKIESILGGQAPTTNFSAPDQFLMSFGIDPSLAYRGSAYPADGILSPTGSAKISGTNITGAPMWLVAEPKNGEVYAYGVNGSVWTKTGSGRGDLNDGGTATGNGAAYYDNYLYCARDTTIARYGPLNGTPAWTDDYWVGTLSKTALTNTTYPLIGDLFAIRSSNHVMHRHSDGKLYIADVVDNQGTIHYIQTTKSSVEGDTDSGSTYDKLSFGYGLWPTAMESYGEFLVIGLYEGNSATDTPIPAKVAFWDTTSDKVNQITWPEFPDDLITGIKNINGTLYFISCKTTQPGTRISRYIGGNSFELVAYLDNSEPPYPGGVANIAGRLMWGSYVFDPEAGGAVYSLGLSKEGFGSGIHVPYVTTSTTAAVTALIAEPEKSFAESTPYIGWTTDQTGGSNNGVDNYSTTINNANGATWWSQLYKIGQPFKITKIRLNLPRAVSTSCNISATVYFDDYFGSTLYTKAVGPTITNTNFSGVNKIVLRPENLVADHSFFLEINWTGVSSYAISLPITIEYELIDD